MQAPVSTMNQREAFRVRPPKTLLHDLVLWFRPPAIERVLPLTELKLPDIRAYHGDYSVLIDDISSKGVRFRFSKAYMPTIEQCIAGHLYVYMKIASPLSSERRFRAMFFGCLLTGTLETDDHVFLRVTFDTHGVGATQDKALMLSNISRSGSSDIKIWCEEIAIAHRSGAIALYHGLDTMYLMEELALL